MKLLFENWRQYLNEQDVSPVTGKPYPGGVGPDQREEYDDWAKGKFSPSDIPKVDVKYDPEDDWYAERAGKTKAAGEKSLKTQLQLSKMETVGDLKKAIRMAKMAKTKEKAKGFIADQIIGLVPYLSYLSQAKSVFDAMRGFIKKSDEKPTQTALDALNIDDEVSAIVDDSVEDNFLKWVESRMKKIPDDTKLAALDMDRLLQKFLVQRYDRRTVSIPKGKE